MHVTSKANRFLSQRLTENLSTNYIKIESYPIKEAYQMAGLFQNSCHVFLRFLFRVLIKIIKIVKKFQTLSAVSFETNELGRIVYRRNQVQYE